MILITGSNGQLGTELRKLLDEKSVAYIATDSAEMDIEYCKCIEPPVRRNEPLNARNRASYCEQESRPTIFI